MYKKLIIIALLFTNLAFAKQVKFSVDMTGQTISPNGVHVYGNFQDEAGFPADWDSETTLMTKEGASNIYSVTVNIPAFRTYEYKFVNGDKSYEIEFVPEKSRVGYDFNDNRWIYVDSSSTDVTNLPALLFGGNAPAGHWMIRFRVDTKTSGINITNGLSVVGNFNNWKAKTDHMVSFAFRVFECLVYVDSAKFEYLFANGSTNEQITGNCINNNSNRFIKINSDTVLAEVCYGQCIDCIESVSPQTKAINYASVYPNPTRGNSILKFNTDHKNYKVSIKDYTGREVINFDKISKELSINTTTWNKGLYFINITGSHNLHSTLKLLVD